MTEEFDDPLDTAIDHVAHQLVADDPPQRIYAAVMREAESTKDAGRPALWLSRLGFAAAGAALVMVVVWWRGEPPVQLSPATGSPLTISFTQTAQIPLRCLHGPSEQPDQRTRREQALKMAQQINRAQNTGPTLIPGPRRGYRQLNELQNVPPTPAGFRVQLNTDGSSYTFSVKDVLDACHYAIFSDQSSLIYEAIARAGVELRPIEGR